MDENIKKIEDFEVVITNYQQSYSCHRKEKRELWSRIILLSSAILGFSVTMFSSDYLSIISPLFLKMGWGLFLINILCGLFLLKRESEFELSQSTANFSRKWDEMDLGYPTKSIDKDGKQKFLALLYLHNLRTMSEKELPFSQHATDIFEKNKKSLTSWQMIKNPEKFYSYSHMNIINWASKYFYGSFVLAMFFLVASVILP